MTEVPSPTLPPPRLHGSLWIVALGLISLTILGVWASQSHIDQIARAQGQVIATARTQVIQSANDGLIEAVLVHEGERVKKGQLLARLDRSQAEAAWRDSQGKVAALKAALTRLESEVYKRPLRFPSELQSHPAFVQNQTELYQRRQAALREEVAAFEEGLALVREELTLSQSLLASGDMGRTEVLRLQKQVADLQGQITNRRNKYFQDAQAELTKAEEDLSTQQQVLAERTAVLERTEIVAPTDGLVNKIHLTTLGAKVRPGDVIMELLPTGGALVIEAKLRPADIAWVRAGLPAAVKLDAYDYSVYGVLRGSVRYISPDALSERTAQGEAIFYRVQIEIDPDALQARNQMHASKPIEIQPGMTSTVEIVTGSQTVLAYLTKPVTKTLSDSLGER